MKKRNFKYPFYVLAIDIGGTKLGGAVLRYANENSAPEIAFQTKVDAQAKEGVEVFGTNILNLAQSLKDKTFELNPQANLLAIGMGCAGRINRQTGNVMTATDNFPGFVNYQLCKNVADKLDIPAYALNDVQAHTLGEARFGAGQNCDNFVLLAVGTGIGGCALINGKLMLGSHGYAGELGHVQVSLGADVPCTCGKVGHLEAVASGSGIERIYKSKSGNNLSGPEISQLANEGDKTAKETIELAGRCLGRIIAMYLSVFDPERIILGGSVIKSGKI